MWVSVHALSGLALGASAPVGVILTLVCALVLHLLLDLVPHWDYTGHRLRTMWAILDVAVSIAAVVALVVMLDLTGKAVMAAVVSALPDLDVFDAVLPRSKHRRWFPSHWRRFPHGRARPATGILVQSVVGLGAITWLILAAG